MKFRHPLLQAAKQRMCSGNRRDFCDGELLFMSFFCYFVIFIHLEIQDLKNKDLEIITSCYFISFLSSQLFVYDLIYYDIFMLCSFGFALYIFWGFPRGCHPDPVGDSARFA